VGAVVSNDEILEEDRKINAQHFENAFYSQPELRLIPSAQPRQSEKTIAAIDPSMILKQLADSPEMMNALASLIVAQAFARKDWYKIRLAKQLAKPHKLLII